MQILIEWKLTENLSLMC